MTLRGSVRSALDESGYEYEQGAGEDGVAFEVRGRSTLYIGVVLADEAAEQVVLRLYSPQRLPADRRGALCEYVVRVNGGLRVGNLDFDLVEGEFAYRQGLDAPGGLLAPDFVSAMLTQGVHAMDLVHDGMLRVAFGRVAPAAAAADAVRDPEMLPVSCARHRQRRGPAQRAERRWEARGTRGACALAAPRRDRL